MALQKIPGRAIQLDSQVSSDIMYHDGTDWVRLAKGDAGQILTVNDTATAPQWGDRFVYQGSEFGYAVMGFTGSPIDAVDRFSFTSDTDAVDHCDAFSIGSHLSCSRSATHGYANAGEIFPHYSNTNRITKFAFASTVDGTDVADVLVSIGLPSGNTSSTHGYVCGGQQSASPQVTVDVIQKYTTSADANSTDVGNLTEIILGAHSANSITYGYRMGGSRPTTPLYTSEIIDKFPFASDTNATDVGNLTLDRGHGGGHSSETHGYTSGGTSYAPVAGFRDIIDKFPFASDTNATDVGNLTANNGNSAGCSSTTFGYHMGGWPNYIDRIEKFPFASDTNATDIANLVIGRDDFDGTQN